MVLYFVISNLVGGFHCWGRTYCLHFQGRNEPSSEGGRLYWSWKEKINDRPSVGKKKRGFQVCSWELWTVNSKNSSIGGGRVTKNHLQANPGCDGPSYSVWPVSSVVSPAGLTSTMETEAVFPKSLVITYQNICHHHWADQNLNNLITSGDRIYKSVVTRDDVLLPL